MTGATVLLRQVHPTFIQQGRVTSQAFRPTPKDEGQLSMYDGDLIEPLASWTHYTTELQLDSIGVLGVTFQEVSTQDLPANPAPERFPEHAVIDFRACTGSQAEKKSKRLRLFAVDRGWLYETELA